MKTPNSHGVYEPDTIEVVARVERASASVNVCQCDDGLHRYAVSFESPTCGFSGPVTLQGIGHRTAAEARLAGIEELLRRLKDSTSEGSRADRAALTDQLHEALRQPSLFDLVT